MVLRKRYQAFKLSGKSRLIFHSIITTLLTSRSKGNSTFFFASLMINDRKAYLKCGATLPFDERNTFE